MLRRLLLYLWYTVAAVVISAALLLSSARLLLPMMDDYRLQVQDWVAQRTGQSIRIGQLDLAWRGLGPEVRLLDVVWMQPNSDVPLLQVDSLGLGFDIWSYLTHRELKTQWISLEGSEITLVEKTPGQWLLKDYLGERQENPLKLLLAQPRLELEQVSLTLQPYPERNLAPVKLHELSLLVRNRNDRHVVNLASHLGQNNTALKLVLDLNGQLDQPRAWSGQGYLALEDLALARWVQLLLPGDLQLQGHLDGQLWLDITNSKPQRVQTRFAIADARLDARSNHQALLVADSLNTALLWQQVESGWTLDITDLELINQGQASSKTQVRISQASLSDGQKHWQLDANDVDSAPYQALIQYFAPQQYRDFVVNSMPSAHFEQAQLALVQTETGVQLENLTGIFDQLQVNAHAKWPGVTNLSGVLSLQPRHGEMTFTSKDSTLNLPVLFREPFDVSTLQGKLIWQRYADRWRLQSPDLRIDTPDLKLQQHLLLDIPHNGGSPYLELRGHFRDGKVGAVHRFLPAKVMHEKPVQWLDDALISGAINDGELLFQGKLSDFPFDAGQGRMEIRANVTDGVLQYRPDWPGIHGIDAQLAFINRTMTINSDDAQIYNTHLRNVVVHIPDLLKARLEVTGDAHGNLDEMLRFVKESPLATRGYPVKQLSGTGVADLNLEMSLRVSHRDTRETTLKGRVDLSGNQLSLAEWDLRLDDLQGQLGFTESGVSTKRMLTRIWDAPAELSIQPGTSDGHTRISVVGALPLLEQIPSQSVLKGYLSGRANWSVTLGLQRNRPGVDLTLQSDMRGIAVSLPEPLGKLPSEERPLRLTTRIGNGFDGKVLLSYGKHSAALALDKKDGQARLEEAVVLFNEGPATLKGVAGLHVGGHLDKLDLSAWRALQQQKVQRQGALELRTIDLGVTELDYAGRNFKKVNITANRNDAGWNLSFAGPMLDGKVYIPIAQSSLPWELKFNHLQLPSVPGDGDSTLAPQDVPPLQFSAQDFQYGKYDLGKVSLESRSSAEGMLIDKLVVDADWIKLNATGSWLKSGGRESSRFKINLTGGDLGKLLETFGYAGNIVGGETHGTLDANWLGGPDDFALDKLEGELDLSIGEGSLEQLEPGAGRVFGLLNLQSLPRRLSLDFSDLFKKGFAFDRIDGSFTLIDTDAYTNDLTIEGPSARIEISGRTGLAAHDYDQLVTVVPQVSSGIPVAGALAGGPAVGAALFLADRLFGKEIEKLSRYQYSVTGPWNAPKFTRLTTKENSPSDAASE